MELSAAVLLLCSKFSKLANLFLLWLVGWLILYRVGLILNHSQLPCNCLGSLFSGLDLSFNTQLIIARWLLLLWAGTALINIRYQLQVQKG